MLSVAFRTDASFITGTGHVMRCLTLADALAASGAASSHFICRSQPGDLIGAIRERGYPVTALPPLDACDLASEWRTDVAQTQDALGSPPADWIVVDHYGLDHRWEERMRPFCRRLMVIDDLADRRHDCDLLLDQNLGRTESDYYGLVPPAAATIVGPKYALLRPGFAAMRDSSLSRRGKTAPEHLLISLGGMDANNVTCKILDSIRVIDLGLKVTVVMGAQAPWRKEVESHARRMLAPTRVLSGVTDMASLMANSDLTIGAAGSTSWERCCLGLPAILVVLAENQHQSCIALQRAGAAIMLSDCDIATAQITRAIHDIASNPEVYLRYVANAAAITDGTGTSKTVQHLLQRTAEATR